MSGERKYNMDDPYEYFLYSLHHRIKETSRRLYQKALWIQDDLARLAKKLEKDGPIEASVNTIGEIQGKGTDLDRLCGELGVLRQVLADYVARYGPDDPKQKDRDLHGKKN